MTDNNNSHPGRPCGGIQRDTTEHGRGYGAWDPYVPLKTVGLFVEDLSDSADMSADTMGEQVLTVEELAKQFSVSSKTISGGREWGWGAGQPTPPPPWAE